MPKTPKNIKRQSELVKQLIVSGEFFSGPLPHPKILAEYEKILPGTTDRIFSMAEKQLNHRQDLEEKVVTANIANEKKGMYMSFVITITAMIIAFILIFSGKTVSGFVALIGTLGLHAANFAYQKYKEEKELELKREENKKLK